MFDPNDTIVAVSSPGMSQRAIVRITGPAAMKLCQAVSACELNLAERTNRVIRAKLCLGLKVDALLYLFFAPRSYTGDDVAEIHLHAGKPVTELLISNLLSLPRAQELHIRPAGPGEFTARAYLAGKMDLSQAEAVNEVVISSNTCQLAAAEKMLSGRLAQAAEQLQASIMDLLSLIELGIDFSDAGLELISRPDALARLSGIRRQLDRLLAASATCESVIDLPAVGIAGVPNAGKSSLLNALTGRARSIVSSRRKTTRDVLTGELTLEHCRCVLFDCAGLLVETLSSRGEILDELAQQAAIDALRNSAVVIFCVDAAKEDFTEDTDVYKMMRTSWAVIDPKRGKGRFPLPMQNKPVIPVAAKCDLLNSTSTLEKRLEKLKALFSVEFIPISIKTQFGLQRLRAAIDAAILRLSFSTEGGETVALTARHRQAVIEATTTVTEAVDELQAGRDEVAAMMLRSAYQRICDITAQNQASLQIDEQILEAVFSRFCIGK